MNTSGRLGFVRCSSLFILGILSVFLSAFAVFSHAQSGNAAVSSVMVPALSARDNLPAADGSLWRFEGPTNLVSGGYAVALDPYSGRINDLAVDPTNPAILYATGATGGLWKYDGNTWASRSAGWPLQSATAVAIDPNNSNRIFVGTGDYKRLDHVEPFSAGIMRSTDAGLTWQRSFDTNTDMFDYAVSRIVVDPLNPLNVLAATGRGSRLPGGNIFRSIDGGDHWNSLISAGVPDANWDDLAVCDKDSSTGKSVFWASANRRKDLDNDNAGNAGGLVYKSTDGGATWTSAFKLTAFLPSADFPSAPDVIKIACDRNRNKIGVFVAIYLVHADLSQVPPPTAGVARIFATYNQGLSWVELTANPLEQAGGGAWAHSAFGITSSKMYVAGSFLATAPLGVGPLNFTSFPDPTSDYQCIVPDPAETDAVYVCSDKGVTHLSPTSPPKSYSSTLGVTQVSRMDVHPRHGGLIALGAQDLGEIVSFFGNGNDVAALGKAPNWGLISGGDGGGTAFKGDVSSHVYVANTYGEVTRYDGTLITPPHDQNNPIPACLVAPAAGLCDLQHPVLDVRSPLLYRGDLDILDWGGAADVSEYSHPDAAATLTGPTDLPTTLNNPRRPVMRALAACPSDSQIVYAGSDYGDVLYYDPVKKIWTALGRAGLPTVLAPILAISPSPSPANCNDVLVAVGYEDEIYKEVPSSIRSGSNAFLGFGTPRDRLFHSANAPGGVWQSAHGGGGAQPLPFAPVSAIVRHPSAPNSTWFVATDIGIFRTDNAGLTWADAGNKLGLPNTLVRDLRLSGDTLYAGTFGRGVWSMDVHRPANFFSVRGVVTQAAKPLTEPYPVTASGPGRIVKYLKNTLTSGTIVTTAPITVTAKATIAAATVSITATNAESVSLSHRTPGGVTDATIAMPAVPISLSLTQFQLTGSSAAALVGLGTAGDWSFSVTGRAAGIKTGRLTPGVLSASVDLQFNGSVSTTTGRDGEFTIEYLAQGSHSLSVPTNGVDPVSLNLSSSITNLNIVIPAVGKYSLAPRWVHVEPHQRVTYTLAYTITNGRSWRDMEAVDLLVQDQSPEPGKGTILRLRFDAFHGTFSLLDPDTGVAGPEFLPGQHPRLENEWATVYVGESSVQTNVPDPSSFTLSIELSFKPHAAHHIYDVAVLGADQTGLSQGPGVGARLQVGDVPPVPLPPLEAN